MKKAVYILIVFGLVVALFSAFIPIGYAQELEPTPAPEVIAADEDVVLFSDLGFVDETLYGPFDTQRYRYYLPDTWKLQPGAEIQLVINTFIGGVGVPPEGMLRLVGGSLEVTFNKVVIETILLDAEGERTITIPIPDDALAPARADGRHELRLTLDSGLYCDLESFSLQTSVSVRDVSRFVLPHEVGAPPLDLTRLPRPIFQQTLEPDSALIVVPDQPTAGELQAAMSVAAGFGMMTGGDLLLNLVPLSELTEEARVGNHLIFVGKPTGFPDLAQVDLPAGITAAGFDLPEANVDDGIIQIAASPWDAAKVVLLVSGASDAGVVKSAQAISSGQVLVGLRDDLAIVQEVHPEQPGRPVAVDYTLADLGYPDETMSGLGSFAVEYLFYIPPGQKLDESAYIELAFGHSALLDYDISSLVVRLNGESIGSARLGEETAQRGSLTINVPGGAVRPGYNRLLVEATLFPQDPCIDPRLGSLWLTVWSDTLLHLPLRQEVITQAVYYDLSEYPDPFALASMLNTTTFVVPPSDANAWKVAAQVAYILGDQANPMLSTLNLYTADNFPTDVRGERHLLVFGKPADLPLISEIGAGLPAQFPPGSNFAELQGLQVVYRLPEGVSLGYLELIPSPWNEKLAMLAVLGSTDEGLQMAGNALTVPELRGQLAGNLAVISKEQIVAIDTRVKADAARLLATAVPQTGIIEVPQQVQPIQQLNPWVIPTLGGVAVLIVVVVLVALIASVRRRSSH